METVYLVIGLLVGMFVGGILVHLWMKSKTVSKQKFDELQNELQVVKGSKDYLEHKQIHLEKEVLDLTTKLDMLQKDKEELIANKAQLVADNRNLLESLEHGKEEAKQMQNQVKDQFENLANRILEEKSERFTLSNQTNIKKILEPLQEKINEFKQQVSEVYEKENKERFSLAEKVKELAMLNQQISDDAKKLTKALKGESKTQGNWGEMILASILEKSGLTLGQEYFLEHQLRDENNKSIYSEFSGKKMRPDAVIKYPDDRSVIIDSKVSLTAFLDWSDQVDADLQAIKLKQHLESVKRHIEDLSSKAYDDYKSSLDFVILFIPNEAAYMAAMQADNSLWQYAYDKRVVLLNPSNLITSLKLISELWKRDKQNKNVEAISERGSKLFNKFCDFVTDLEGIGKSLNTVQKNYSAAYNKLTDGRDNLVLQAKKLQDLGVKTKKELSNELIERAETAER